MEHIIYLILNSCSLKMMRKVKAPRIMLTSNVLSGMTHFGNCLKPSRNIVALDIGVNVEIRFYAFFGPL